jgi:hypothetical protein
MFNLREFVLKGLKQAVGNEAEYKIRDIAAGWLDKGVLLEADLAELDLMFESGEVDRL